MQKRKLERTRFVSFIFQRHIEHLHGNGGVSQVMRHHRRKSAHDDTKIRAGFFKNKMTFSPTSATGAKEGMWLVILLGF
jgi:hypothetical protein